MKSIGVALWCLSMITGATAFAQERGWRGLVPLHSTRTDVERLLGQPIEALSKASVFYRTPNETVIISYSKGLPCGIGEKYGQWRVPRDTVETIYVSPIKPLLLSEVAIDESKYKKEGGGHRIQDIYYINDQEGVEMRVFMGEVMNIRLYRGLVDAHLSCFPLSPECEGDAPLLRDVYRNMPLAREQKRWDNFAVSLLRISGSTGYIIVYAGKSTRFGEAKETAERAKTYLVRVHNVLSSRLVVIDGGYRQEKEVHLYVVPNNACAPIATPTVDPRDVKVTRSHR